MKRQLIGWFAVLVAVLFISGCGDDTTITGPINLDPNGALQGFVKDYRTNAPVTGAVVTLYAAGTRTYTTAADGYWYFEDVRAEDDTPSLVYTITDGTHLPMAGTAFIYETVGGGNDDIQPQYNGLTTVMDYMVGAVTVSGFVHDAGTGFGINGATVIIYGHGPASWKPAGSNASVTVDTTSLTATTAARTEGGDGYYTITGVPALNTFGSAIFGAYATGYEFSISTDLSTVNLQYATSALADFKLNDVDNMLGLVSATVTTIATTGTAQNMMIMRDASGGAANGTIANIDMASANQLVFNLIFDQPVDTTRFFGDTIQLYDNDGAIVILPNLAPVWANSYSVTLTGAIDIEDLNMGSEYSLRTGRIVLGTGGAENIAAAQNLARFQVYNSTYASVNPTPAVYVTGATLDSYLVGTNDSATTAMNSAIHYYDLTQANAIMTDSQYYNAIWELETKTNYGIVSHLLSTGIDIAWADTNPEYSFDQFNVYVRERYVVGTTIDEVINNWERVAAVGSMVRNNSRIIYNNLTLPFNLYGGTSILSFGNQIDIAVTVEDTLGVETAIDTTKILTLRDNQSPEIKSLSSVLYDVASINFSESMMDSTATVSTINPALFTITAPTWVADTMTELKLNITGTATATVDAAGVGTDHLVAGTGVITFSSAGEADLFFIGQGLKITYSDGRISAHTVTAIDTYAGVAGANPTVTIGGAFLDDFSTTPATISVDNETTNLRSGSVVSAVYVGGVGDVSVPCASSTAVGDILILRDADYSLTGVSTEISVTVTEVDGTNATIAATDTTGYDTIIFQGDILTVSATDEAGNGMHSDANEVTWSYNASGASDIK